MQGVEAENQAKSRNDEESINFRPSPNFKHMKKYLKSKFEEANQAMANSSPPQEAPASSSIGHDKREKVNSSVPVVQPPLPPNPPPPDSPPIINLKKEIEDDEYQCSTTENSTDFNHTEELKTVTIKTDQSEVSDKPEVTMCRNFARGTCKKGASCIFAHELILSQLPGVYTFCRNFQNSVCTFPKCKFVHATVFEKEYFFRTGYLPPHTLAHLKEAVLQPPPPPPPEETPTDVPQVYTNGPSQPALPCINPVAVVYNHTAPSVDRADTNIFANQTPGNLAKREWSETDEFSSSPRDLDSSEPLAKKCKNCDNNEFRLQYNKNKVEKMVLSNEELNNKISHMTKKNAKLSVVLGALFKPAKNSTGTKGLNISPEKDQNLLTNNHFTTLLAKMLLNSDGGVPPDAS